MRILQLVQKPQRRGAEIFVAQLNAALHSQGHITQTVYLYPHKESKALTLTSRDQLLAGSEAHSLEKIFGVHPGLLQKLHKAVDKFQPDIIQVNGASTVKYGAFLRLTSRRQPWVLIYRNIGNPQDWVRGWQRYFFYQWFVIPQVDGVIGVSQATLNVVKSFYQLNIPIRYIPNGIEISKSFIYSNEQVRNCTQTPLGACTLLFVGNLSLEKRVDRLLRVVDRVTKQMPELYVWLVGDGPQRLALEAQVKALSLERNVRFLGVQENVSSFMAAADLFMLTSDTEGIPAVILEAGAQGLPVIATQVGGIPECILDGETGLLVEPQDEVGLAKAVLGLLSDPIQRRTMGHKAQVWIRENFAIDQIAQHYLAFYSEVLLHKYQ
ncbi:MAG: glycosyltransferase family 1 protein [Caldilinea sp. CFX5]|nr:glycosyltransferase family 1 protein [Caldilinea sp. CFX5]